MTLTKQLKDADIDDYAIQLLGALTRLALGAGNLPKMGGAFELKTLKAAYAVLCKFENFEANKQGLIEIKNLLFASAYRKPDKYIMDMGAALNMMIIHFDKNSSLKTELEEGIAITINHLIRYRKLLEEKIVIQTRDSSSSALGKRRIGFFAEKQKMILPVVSAAKKQRVEKETSTVENENAVCTSRIGSMSNR